MELPDLGGDDLDVGDLHAVVACVAHHPGVTRIIERSASEKHHIVGGATKVEICRIKAQPANDDEVAVIVDGPYLRRKGVMAGRKVVHGEYLVVKTVGRNPDVALVK